MSMKTLSIALTVLLGASAAAAGGAPDHHPSTEAEAGYASDAPTTAPAGRWVGPIVVEKGRSEVGIVLDLEQDEDGTWSGTMAVPYQRVEPKPVIDLLVEDNRVSWGYKDASGVALLSATFEGDRMTGIDQEQGQTFPFELRRVGRPGHDLCPDRELNDLSGTGDLREIFNRDVGKVRILMVLAPDCGLCRGGARLVERYLLAPNPEADLATYVVWMPISEKDSRELAAEETCSVVDPRASHYWIGDTSLSDALRPAVGLPADGPTAWDVYLIYGPDARWEGEAPPTPSTWMHRMGKPLPRERILNAAELAEELGEVLP